MMFRNRRVLASIPAVLTASAFLTGCQIDIDHTPNPSGQDFISDNPRGGAGQPGSGEEDGDTSGTGGNPAPADPSTGEDPERAITEADIIQVHEGKLYALSRYSGLSIIDISTPDQLTLLGRYGGTSGTPFEMYLEDGVVYAMFSSWGQYIWDAAAQSYQWVQTSHIEALDVSNPASVGLLGSFDLPGSISDSRVVGDVLYAVTFEDGYCWDCDAGAPNTSITSINIANPAAISVVDQLSFADNDPYGYGWRRSVSATADRMYVAGIEWNGQDEGHSTIQVVDISDPGGQLELGATVEATGQIQSRWQMDEHEGVLRVVSQPGVWWSNAMPAVQTFTVTSSQEVVPLGYTELQLPQPETLRSVRFDGTRGYAITAEQTDPLFTIDLSNPAQPAQLGELEMPGWIYHMEPRGDRLLALGFDNSHPEGSLNVSLIDVSNMAQPTLIERVHFGGQWSNVAEDQDRIHKAFTLLDNLGLILVPFAGWTYDGQGGCGSYESGIQLLDFTTNALSKRGVAPQRGMARRAFLHESRLFAVSDEEVRTFDIANRDAPQKVTDLGLATVANQSVVAGDLVVRLASDWWTSAARIEVVPAANPGQADALGALDLSPLFPAAQGCYGWGIYSARLFAHGQHAYLVWPSDDGTKVRVATVDLTDAAHPSLAGQIELPFTAYDLFGWYGSGAVVSSGDPVVQVGSTLVFRRLEADPYGYYDPYYPQQGGVDPALTLRKAWLEVVDLSNPAQPSHAATVALPDAAGHTLMRVSGTQVMLSHWVPLPNDSSKARFYLDRIDVASPASPAALVPVNVPGSLVSYDSSVNRMLTVDYQRLITEDVTSETCWQSYGYDASFEPNDPEDWYGLGTCTGMRRAFKLVQVYGASASLLDTQQLEDGTYFWSVFVGDDRVFASVNNSQWATEGDPYWSSSRLLVLGGIHDGELQFAEVEGEELGYTYPVVASGTRLVSAGYAPTGIWTLDAADMDAMAFEQKAELRAYVNHVTVSGDLALCSLGTYGLEVVNLSE